MGTENNSLEDQLWAKSLALTPGGVHSPVRAFHSVGGTPVFFKKAQGAYLWDLRDRVYIDFCMSFGPLILGHRDPEVTKAVHEITDTVWSLGTCEPFSIALADFICTQLPWVEKIRFVSSGTEAVMSALRLARAATGREGILKFAGSYHGHVDSLLVGAGSGLAAASLGESAGLAESVHANTYVLPLDDEEALKAFFAHKGEEIAVVIAEPLPANHGLLVQRQAYWELVAKLSRQYGALLLFDEVISGFRVALQGMSGLLGIEPDLLCLGKVIGGGFPVGAYGGKKELMDMVAPLGSVYQAGTLSAHPFAMCAGLSSLQKCRREQVYQSLETKTQYFCNQFEAILNQNSESHWEIVSFASLFWIKKRSKDTLRSIDKIPKKHQEDYAVLFHKLLRAGIYLAPSGLEVCFLSTAHTQEVLEEALEKIQQALAD